MSSTGPRPKPGSPSMGGFPLKLDRIVGKVTPKRPNPSSPSLEAKPVPGHGLESRQVRERMVARLQAQGIHDARVLLAMKTIARHEFVDSALISQAYEDTSLPIGLEQTISKPSVVARMLELLLLRPSAPEHLGKVLEIGTGCGYQAAVLCELSRQVFSIERLRPLHDKARTNLEGNRPSHLRLIYGDGRHGHPPNAPYDTIIAAAGGVDLPQNWLDQLAPLGRLVAPLGSQDQTDQVLMVVDRLADGRLVSTRHEAVRFVPLQSGLG